MANFKVKSCEHLDSAAGKSRPLGEAICEECVKTGGTWVHLRTCQSCGQTLCCDSSPNKHATAHFESSGHPVMRSAEPGESWLYCYEHRLFKK